MKQLLAFLLLFWSSVDLATLVGTFSQGSVYCSSRKCTLKIGVLDPSSDGWATYNDTLLDSGWGILDVVAGYNAHGDDLNTMYAAGFLEGALTAKRIYQHYQNMKAYFLGNKSDDLAKKLGMFFDTQDSWAREQVNKLSASDPMWRHVGMILAQFDGLVDGYKSVAPATQKLDVFAFQVLNGVGDLLDLVKAVEPGLRPDFSKFTHQEAKDYVQRHGFCSALIKLLGAYEDVFFSHSSWFIYQATMRIYKHYNFNVLDPATHAKKVSFSSYPGFLESLDDFYLLGSKMVMLQTTNNVFNTSLYQFVKPQALLAWQRVRVANMMANSGKEWAEVLARYNSGTYNNQYMVLDLKKIVLGQEVKDNALWVVEQIPTRVAAGDVTSILRAGYWPSYNVPFFEDIYNMSGYPNFVKAHGLDYSYQLAPRAKIFRRDEGNVVDMESMKHIMRFNEYKTDPYSEGDSCNSICCRGDLRKDNPGAFGCYDTKVSDYSRALDFTADIINGPTLGTALPPFQWTSEFNNSHVGLPLEYKFGFITTTPRFKP